MYKKYLPQHEYIFDWHIEISPYTLNICDFSKNLGSDAELILLKRLLKISDDDIEQNYADILIKLGVPEFVKIDSMIPADRLPTKRTDQLRLLFRLMNFPPLEELSVFFKTYGDHINRQNRELSKVFPGMNVSENFSFAFQGALGATFFCIDHASFKRRGLNGIESDLAIPEFKQEFEEIRAASLASAETLKDVSICPCCGEPQEITIPEEVAQYMLLINNRKLAKRAGLQYSLDFMMAQKKLVVEAVTSIITKINDVAKPDCLILVEGESEEISIPILALKSGLFLTKENIKVFNAKSKQKLEAEFMSQREKFPLMKMICLLDSDALKEAENISRLVKDNRDKYHLIHIKKGCFEDLFNLSKSVEILNLMYPDGESILIEDFDTSKDFGQNIGRILHDKKKAKFDKVKFAKLISSSVEVKDIPIEVKDLLEAAKKFAIKPKFLSKK